VLRVPAPPRTGVPGIKWRAEEESIPKDAAPAFDPKSVLTRIEKGKTTREYHDKEIVFSQGDAADAVFFIQRGRVKLTVVSARGKEAVIGVLEQGSFFGEGCLAGQPVRMASASATEPCRITRVGRSTMVRLLHREPEFAESFIAYLLSRNVRIEEDLVDQLFNSSEKRLARILLLLAHFGKESRPETVIPKVSQETLAAMVGTTRSRVSYFMNRFRKLGFIHYNGGLRVHSALLTVVLRD
jgi:CRP/FNR family transcriptional regulator, cyclic AMP receptor protein